MQETRTEAQWQARERELLEANNRYLQEARDARALVQEGVAAVEELMGRLSAAPSSSPSAEDLVERCVEIAGDHLEIDYDGDEPFIRSDSIESAIEAIIATIGAGGQADAFQERVQPWMMACFGPEISADKLERSDRLAEEVLELLQSGGYPRERVAALTDYVYGREIGEPAQEVGGAMVTLAAYCLAHDLDMHECGETELARIWTKVEKIRAKQAAKPTGSALPVALSQPHPADACLMKPMEGVSNKAEEGRQAYKAGQSKDSNPYPQGTARYWQWSSGWLDERAFRPRTDERVMEALQPAKEGQDNG